MLVTIALIVSIVLFAGCYFINPLEKDYGTNVALMTFAGTVVFLFISIIIPVSKNRNLNYLLRVAVMLMMIAAYFFL